MLPSGPSEKAWGDPQQTKEPNDAGTAHRPLGITILAGLAGVVFIVNAFVTLLSRGAIPAARFGGPGSLVKLSSEPFSGAQSASSGGG
jgi:hypothetical protein